VADPNYRSLHQQPTPSGGGVAFALVFLVVLGGAWLARPADPRLMMAVGAGGFAAALAGFLDDRHETAQRVKLAIYASLSAWALFCAGGRPLVDLPWVPAVIDLAFSWIALVWLMNLYNFMDGIDGMASSGAVGICTILCLALWLRGGDQALLFSSALLAACCLGFLVFNWPPARIFMGDAGSLFLGYSFAAMVALTVTRGQVSAWTWLVILGYFAGDTTTTVLWRMATTRRFYQGHRSHAYQNLARVLGSHLRVVRGVLLYQLLWLVPLTVWSVRRPDTAPLAAALALGPVVAWTIRFGPRMSSA
jgi:Fuc2NAc and GlcNAc transferase